MRRTHGAAVSKPGSHGPNGTVLEREGTLINGVWYPGEDGQPMGQSILHGDEIVRIFVLLAERFADDPDVLVSRDALLYYEEGNPRAVLVPDVFVVFGVPKRTDRVSYFVWLEGRPPDVVIEISSISTRARDHREKRAIYAGLGVAEYILYDPVPAARRSPLTLPRLEGDTYGPVRPEADGSLTSERLGLRLRIADGRLRFYEAGTGVLLRSKAERTDEAESALTEVQTRLAALEARLAELEQRQREGGGRA